MFCYCCAYSTLLEETARTQKRNPQRNLLFVLRLRTFGSVHGGWEAEAAEVPHGGDLADSRFLGGFAI